MAMGEVLMPVRITLLQLWLEVWLCLLGWPQIGHSQYHSPPEVVIPLRVTGTSRGERAPGWLSYSLHFGGQRHIIHMKAKKHLVSRDLSVFTYTDQGALLEDHPFVQTNCYYQGYVEGDPESLVSLSTCLGGLQGMLQVKDNTYEIKFKSHSTTFEHLVYKTDSEETQSPPLRCALTDDEIARQLKLQESNNSILMQSSYEGWWTHRRLVEMVLVVEHERYVFKERNLSYIQEELLNIVNAIDVIYIPLDVGLFISGYEVWNEYNLVNITRDIYAVLERFCSWKSLNLQNRIYHDSGHLFINRGFGGHLGLAHVGLICHARYNCAVDSIVGNSVPHFAYIVAHELGHNLGMSHDQAYCKCATRQCIMFPSKTTSTKFSNCSYSYMWTLAGRSPCFLNLPHGEALARTRCGNAVVEEGEECDCGSLKMCTSDHCCTLNCTLKTNATCGFGLCCNDCQFQPAGTVCRDQLNDCDLPEWCNGTSHECPADVHIQDGTHCMFQGYCYNGRCNHHTNTCEEIFGPYAYTSEIPCYREINMRGDRFGNCGIHGSRYTRCPAKDILCGRIHCQNVTTLPLLKDHYTVHWTEIGNHSCWTSDHHLGMNKPDIGSVTDGSPCGTNRVCMNHTCIENTIWNHTCTAMTCNEKGVCNNKNHCHCLYEWEPPFCLSSGHGGSLDSGPPPRRIPTTLPTTTTTTTTTTMKTTVKPEKKKSNSKIFFIFLILFLLLLLLLLLLLWSRNRKKVMAGGPSAPPAPGPTPSTKPKP